ncbi:MAG: hypothetical protein IKE46_08205 [Selenomonadaceae bacterium]|nr:hypothetical protein [Selenomonadaceae bacterium]
MKKEMTMKITLSDEILNGEQLNDEQLDKVNGGFIEAMMIIGEAIAQYAVGKIAETAVSEFTDKTIPYNAAPNFQLIEPDFMPKI